MDYNKLAIKKSREKHGKLEIKSKISVKNKRDLSIAYTPGVAAVSKLLAKNKALVYDYTIKRNTVAIVSDGSRVLGLGNLGPEGAIPVMEGKAVLFKQFADIDAFPIVLATQDKDKIIQTIKAIAPIFGGINLEDIESPKCFEVEAALQDIGIPVMHDDQHGTAIVILAGLINAARVVKKDLNGMKIVISGAGAAGTAAAKLMYSYGLTNILILDSKGIISRSRKDLTDFKKELANITNPKNIDGSLEKAVKDADAFIGVSAPNILTEEMVKSMAAKPIIFALNNPIPEIDPKLAKKAGAAVIGTARSDLPNQINNLLVFPGVFRGALDARAKRITAEMKLAAALAIANAVKPKKDKIIPTPFDNVAPKVAAAVKRAAR